MNQIVAFLLFYLPEEEAFWAFCQLMTSAPWTMHGLFCPNFPKLFRFQAQFEKIMKKMLPKIYKHFLTYQVQTDLYTIRWFMLCYLGRNISFRFSSASDARSFRLSSLSVDPADLGYFRSRWRTSLADNGLLHLKNSSKENLTFENIRQHQYVSQTRSLLEFRQFEFNRR